MIRALVLYLGTLVMSIAIDICSDVEDCLGRAHLQLSATSSDERNLALQLYAAAIGFDHHCKDAWLGLGGCQKDLGQHSAALLSFASAFSLDPLCWRVGLNIASILGIQSDFNTSMRMYRHVIRAHPYHPQAYYSIGFIHLNQVSMLARPDFSITMWCVTRLSRMQGLLGAACRYFTDAWSLKGDLHEMDGYLCPISERRGLGFCSGLH